MAEIALIGETEAGIAAEIEAHAGGGGPVVGDGGVAEEIGVGDSGIEEEGAAGGVEGDTATVLENPLVDGDIEVVVVDRDAGVGRRS